MASSINEEPNSNTPDLYSGSEGSGVFSVARGKAAPPFEKKESILNKVAEFVDISVIFPWMFSVFLWRNDRYHSLFRSLKEDCICIIAPVCQKVFRLEPLD